MKLSALLLAPLLLIPVAAWAGDFSYDYAELDYQHFSPQQGESSKGPSLQFSYTISDPDIQVLAGYARMDTPATPTDITSHGYWIGIRGENSFSEDTDYYTDLLYLNNRTTFQRTARTDDGYRLLLGVRHRATARIEFDASLAHDYLTRNANEAAIGLIFNATSYLAFGLSYAHDTLHANTTTLRLRVCF